MHRDWLLPTDLCNDLGNHPSSLSMHHLVSVEVMSTQKTLFNIFQPSTTKRKQTSTTGQKRTSNVDPQEISRLKKYALIPKRFQEFACLIFSENHMKCKTFLNVCGLLAKSFQAFVHGLTNFWDP